MCVVGMYIYIKSWREMVNWLQLSLRFKKALFMAKTALFSNKVKLKR